MRALALRRADSFWLAVDEMSSFSPREDVPAEIRISLGYALVGRRGQRKSFSEWQFVEG